MCNPQSIEIFTRTRLNKNNCHDHTGKNYAKCWLCLLVRYCFCDGSANIYTLQHKISEINHAFWRRTKSRSVSRQMYPVNQPATTVVHRFRQSHINGRSTWIDIVDEATGYDAKVNNCLSLAADKASSNHYYCDGYAYRWHLIEQITVCYRERLANRLAKRDLLNSVLNEIQFHPKFMQCALDRIDMDTYFEQLGY